MHVVTNLWHQQDIWQPVAGRRFQYRFVQSQEKRPATRAVDNGEHGVYNDRNPPPSGVSTASKQSAEFRARRLASTAGSATTRRYLSEPPLAYRAPAATAAADELGEDEAKKERDRKAAARKDKGFSFKNLIPWN